MGSILGSPYLGKLPCVRSAMTCKTLSKLTSPGHAATDGRKGSQVHRRKLGLKREKNCDIIPCSHEASSRKARQCGSTSDDMPETMLAAQVYPGVRLALRHNVR